MINYVAQSPILFVVARAFDLIGRSLWYYRLNWLPNNGRNTLSLSVPQFWSWSILLSWAVSFSIFTQLFFDYFFEYSFLVECFFTRDNNVFLYGILSDLIFLQPHFADWSYTTIRLWSTIRITIHLHWLTIIVCLAS